MADEFADEFADGFDEAALAALEAAEADFARPPAASPPAPDGAKASALLTTLTRVWGHAKFRSGQQECLEAVMARRDCAVYWATGSGKSTVYQLPPLARPGGIGLVVSPLISLMEDQVKALNLKTGENVACYLGSAQSDASIEQRARQGDFRLVYATPEKVNGTGLVNALRALRTQNGEPRLMLVAVDEAHCVSEWGHDFRPEYRRIGEVLKASAAAGDSHVPIIALTASATPQVRRDIEQSLFANPRSIHTSSKTMDRPNLALSARRKGSGGLLKHIAPLVARLEADAKAGRAAEQTVVYCSTRSEVDAVTLALQRAVAASADTVAAYHAGLGADERRRAHYAFLSGAVRVIVATTAFGMGIDKADIRHVVHYSPPKTFEEYCQQIGRAGRDGASATCLLLFADSEFTRYDSDFYTQGLAEQAKEAVRASRAALRAYAEANARAGARACRRRLVLDFFGESPADAQWSCGTCDLCRRRSTGPVGGAAHRDFMTPCRLVLLAARVPGGASATDLVGLATGHVAGKGPSGDWLPPGYAEALKAIEPRYQQARLDAAVKNLVTKDHIKEFLPLLLQEGFVGRSSRQSGNFRYDVYEISAAGQAQLGRSTLMLPAPQFVLDAEAAKDRRVLERRAELESEEIDLTAVPQHELDAGEGPVITAELDWKRRLARWRAGGHGDRAAKHEAVLARLLAWRNATALEFQVAPYGVVPDHIVKKIAYTLPTTTSDLEAAGVRFHAGVAPLAALIESVARELELFAEPPADEAPDEAIELPLKAFRGARWAFALEVQAKKPKSWELSQARFLAGESCAAIASSQPQGKAILASTVLAHVLKALTYGQSVDLTRLAACGARCHPVDSPPGVAAWRLLDAALWSRRGDVDVVGADKYDVTVFADAVGGDYAAAQAVPWKDRSPQQLDVAKIWSNRIKWWEALKRAGYTPPNVKGDEPPEKKQRV